MVPKDFFFAQLKKVFAYNNFDTRDHSELKLLALSFDLKLSVLMSVY